MNTQISRFADQSHFGPEMGIVEEMSLSEDLELAFLKFGMGSTKIGEHWDPENETSHYKRMGEFLQGGLEQLLTEHGEDATSTPVDGIFWLQGESDSSAAKTANAHAAVLERFVRRLRRDLVLNEQDASFIASEIVWPNGKKAVVVNEGLRRVCGGSKNSEDSIPN